MFKSYMFVFKNNLKTTFLYRREWHYSASVTQHLRLQWFTWI